MRKDLACRIKDLNYSGGLVWTSWSGSPSAGLGFLCWGCSGLSPSKVMYIGHGKRGLTGLFQTGESGG